MSDTLSEYGITIKLSSLDGYADYQQASTAWHGVGWLSRLWCQKIRPLVSRRAHDLARTEYKEKRLIYQAELLSAVIDNGERV